MSITTTDNNCGNCEVEESHIENVSSIANKTVKILCEQNSVILFPENTKDKIEDKNIFSLSSCNKLTTGNIMGFIGVNDTVINIKSRFANTEGEDYFMHYMLCKVFSINIVNLETSSSKDKALDFLIYLFPYFLNKALQQGLFKKYQSYEYNNSNVKGTIDINRHIKRNIPFMGKIAYNVREHSSDNHVTELIRHVIEYIKTKPLGKAILSCSDTKDSVSKIIFATPCYDKNKRAKIINKNIKPLSHPYFYEYLPLQKLCMQILRYEKNKFGSGKDKIYGVLFDGAWLWEEYLNKVLTESNLKFIHAENNNKKNGIKLFNNFSREVYPDFYSKDNKTVMDAKYKRINKSEETDREDLYQLITYMHILKSDNGVLIYPDSGGNILLRSLEGYGGEIYKYGFGVAESNIIKPEDKYPFKKYSKEMKEREECFIKFVDKLYANAHSSSN